MTLSQVWGSLIVLVVCPLLGGIPLIEWITYGITGRQLSKLGTGNISVSAAFYHGGKLVGILAVLSEAAKGIIAVLLARNFFPLDSVWEIIALIALVIGRYWMGKGAGTTNVVWGVLVHDPIAFALVFFIGGISFTINRNRLVGKLGVLVLFAIIMGLRHPSQPEYFVAATALASLLAWIYQQIPDDLDLPATGGEVESKTVFSFFRGNKAIRSLERKLDASKVGQKAANLSFLKRLGYSVPDGWVIPAGDDPKTVTKFLQPSVTNPVIVRSSAIGEDSANASAAGQYLSIANITSREALYSAIIDCQASYIEANAIEYRRLMNSNSDNSEETSSTGMAVIVQKQIEGLFSGVAFSRNPLNQFSQAVAIEVLPGGAAQVVSGKVTPQRYLVNLPELTLAEQDRQEERNNIVITQENSHSSSVTIPTELLESVALLARELEELFQGIPQDIEWTYDGEKLWLLQARSITTLQPIWTRKIAAEVIPGLIKPLTWSINKPLTCGVWGEIFHLVLGKKGHDLDFQQTATLHYNHAYFNATLLGTIFLRMGLPTESLEFLTRGAKFSKPPLKSTLSNLSGLWKLCKREWNLVRDFQQDYDKLFASTLADVRETPATELSPTELLSRVETILEVLEHATYYSILAPLSFALRQAIFKVEDRQLDQSQTPEIESMRSLADLAADALKLLAAEKITTTSSASLFAQIAENPEGESVLARFQQWLDKYGYLSQVATDIAIPRWRDNPRPAREMFTRFFSDRQQRQQAQFTSQKQTTDYKTKLVQTRLNLKGKVGEVYNQLLAHLRWSFLALEQHWLQEGKLSAPGDIFYLKMSEIHTLQANYTEKFKQELEQLIVQRKAELAENQKLKNISYLVYGDRPPVISDTNTPVIADARILKGIGTSPGKVEGSVKILSDFANTDQINKQTIIVVPYTDAGWSPVLARAGGLIAEVGGRLSHGAIIAREYGIPAVMDIPNINKILHNGQKVKIDGLLGVVEILD